jgi:hypothetical protein
LKHEFIGLEKKLRIRIWVPNLVFLC